MEFFIVLFVIVLCILFFGKADSKKEILNQVGLDLSPGLYETQKQNEYKKYCIKAMSNAIDKFGCIGRNEMEFLENLSSILYKGAYGEEDNNLRYLEVKNHYITHACTVVDRRIDALKSNNTFSLMNNCDFTQKSDLKKYVKNLWEKYQCPWPSDWQKKDGM